MKIREDNGESWKVKLQTGRFKGEPHEGLLYYSSPFLPKLIAHVVNQNFKCLHQEHLCRIPRRQSCKSA
jgi:hypothetical protein